MLNLTTLLSWITKQYGLNIIDTTLNVYAYINKFIVFGNLNNVIKYTNYSVIRLIYKM